MCVCVSTCVRHRVHKRQRRRPVRRLCLFPHSLGLLAEDLQGQIGLGCFSLCAAAMGDKEAAKLRRLIETAAAAEEAAADEHLEQLSPICPCLLINAHAATTCRRPRCKTGGDQSPLRRFHKRFNKRQIRKSRKLTLPTRPTRRPAASI